MSLGGILQSRKQSQFDQAFFLHHFRVFSVRLAELKSNNLSTHYRDWVTS